ncbi:MAG TPA: heliorhodopsin HeR [Nevskiaceae bacterium]|nr:heliorhodopsin HeR [Nevskiaceae bacterium]
MIKKVLERLGPNKEPLHLYKWNVWLAGLHAVQGLAILVLSANGGIAITTSYLTTDALASATSGHGVLAVATKQLFTINVAYLVAAFFFIAAIVHALAATKCRTQYDAGIKKGVSYFRWIEYGLSSGVMLITIALLVGVRDAASLAMIFAFALIAGLLGLALEIYSQNKGIALWVLYAAKCAAGIMPWIVLAKYVGGMMLYGSGKLPGYVYAVLAAMAVLFGCFTIAKYLQHQKKGRWADYVYSEQAYMMWSLVTKTVLAWIIFVGTLRP